MEFLEYVRQARLAGYAVFDLILAYGGMYMASPALSKMTAKVGILVPRRAWLWLTLPISIVAHVLVGNITPMTQQFFDLSGYAMLKLVVLVSLFMGLAAVMKENKIWPKK